MRRGPRTFTAKRRCPPRAKAQLLLDWLEVLDPAAFAGALEVLLVAPPAAPLGEPDPLEVEDLGDEERDDPGEQLGAGEEVHGRNLPRGAAGRNGPGGLFFGAGRPTSHGDAPRAARREQLFGID